MSPKKAATKTADTPSITKGISLRRRQYRINPTITDKSLTVAPLQNHSRHPCEKRVGVL
jgi:hypothetical protein